MDMFALFARPKPCRILIMLRDTENPWYLSKLAKSSETTYVYVNKLVYKLQDGGFVVVEKKGKKRFVRLTEKGMKVANAIEELMNRSNQ